MALRDPPPRPFLKWVGGKRQLLPELLETVNAGGEFRRYHEPFVGGAALYFALAQAGRLSGHAFLSDVNQNLMDAYLGVRDDVERVISVLQDHKKRHCEEYFYKVRARVPKPLTERAARIIYLNKTCFNGLYRENSKGQFNAPFGRYKNPLICDEENLRAVAATLQQADLDVRPFTSVLNVAEPGDLVYFDPPYDPVSKTADFTAYSRYGFGADAQEELSRVFHELDDRGVKTILSNSLTDFVQRLYRGSYIRPVFATRLVNSRADRRGKVSEAIVTNFPKASTRTPLNGERINGARGELQAWLMENDYEDVILLIDEVVGKWRAEGKRTRRNWWEVLAGDARGNPRIVGGRIFPVLRAARLRQGLPVTETAIYRSPSERPPPDRTATRIFQTPGESSNSRNGD